MGKNVIKAISILLFSAVVILVAVVGVPITKDASTKNYGSISEIKLGLDLAGGVSITYEAVEEDPTSEQMEDAQNKIRKRADSISTEAEVYLEGKNRLNVDIPGINDAEGALEQIGKPGAVKFVAEDGTTVIDGSHIANAKAQAGQDPQTGQVSYWVQLTLNDTGKDLFAKGTKENLGKSISIVYDEKVISSPTVEVEIPDGVATITNMASIEEAQELASTIRIGSLQVELKELRSNIVGAKLGQEAIDRSLLAGIIGLALIFLFMIAVYRVPGLASGIALFVYAAGMIVALSLLKITLTLPGIAGIILSIGMAVDANVVIFSRIREEVAVGKTIRSSIKSGFDKALSAIIDGNVTTLIAAAVLYFLGTGPIKGFAQTLALGIVLSMITALFFTRFILNTLFNLGLKNKKLYGSQKEMKPFPFVKTKKIWISISVVIIAVGLIFLPINKSRTGDILNFGIDFKGGTSTQIEFPENVDVNFEMIDNELKPLISEITGDKEAQAQQVTGENQVIIKSKELTKEQRSTLTDKLVEKYSVDKAKITSSSISATVGAEMKRIAVVSVLVAAALMLLYIAFRFKDIMFGISSITALIHDLLIVIAVYSIFRIPVNNAFIACILTILGYSINSTIVVFDRIRENKIAIKGNDRDLLVDTSITQTLSRSIYSSLTTFVTVLILNIVGVAAIKEFTLPLMVGIAAGAYSSIFIAAPLWDTLKGLQAKKKTK
jgi:SecD/SecF fusion protein